MGTIEDDGTDIVNNVHIQDTPVKVRVDIVVDSTDNKPNPGTTSTIGTVSRRTTSLTTTTETTSPSTTASTTATKQECSSPTKNIPTNLLVGCINNSPTSMVGGHVIGCRRSSQQHKCQTHEEEATTVKKSNESIEEELLASANEKVSKIKIASLNAYNLISSKKHKVNQLEAIIREENINIFCIQETWMKEDILDTEIHIDEFRTYRQDRGGTRKGGGVVTYIDTGLTVTQEESFTNGVCDVIYTEVEELNIGVINIYRPPSSDKDSFNEILQKVREWTSQTQREIILLGDLNFKSMNAWTESDKDGLREDIVGKRKTQWGRELTQAIDLLEFIEDNGLTQWVTEETRKDSILDLVFTNSMSMRGTETIKNSVEFSDHNTVISTFLTARKEDKGEPPVNYHKSDLPLYKIEELEEEDWNRINKILFNQSWSGIAEMSAEELQELIVKRYVEAIDMVAEKKTTKKEKKRTPIHLRRFIRMK